MTSEEHNVLESISSTFYEQLLRQYFCARKLQSQTVTREKLCKTLLYEKDKFKQLLCQYICAKKIQNQAVIRGKPQKTLSQKSCCW